MLKVEDRFMIKDLHRRGVTISDIARITGYDRKTIRAILNGPLSPAPQRRKARAKKLDPFVPYLEKRDPDEAERVARQHIRNLSQELVELLGIPVDMVKPLGAICVTANGKIPKRAKIKFPTFARWTHLRHNGLVSQSAEEGTTHAESGGPVHDQRLAPQRRDDQRHRPHHRV